MTTADVIVIGGGILGVSIAYHLLVRDPRLRVVLLEKEGEVGTGSTARATGGVRHQFSTETNVRLTQLSYPYFADAERILGRSVDFTPHGYLFVTTEPGILEQLRKNVALQRRLGVRSRVLDTGEMKPLLPQLVVDDLVGGTFCPDDGSADPYGVLQGFLALARERGLRVLTSQPVVAVNREGERVIGAETSRDRYRAPVVSTLPVPMQTKLAPWPASPFHQSRIVVRSW